VTAWAVKLYKKLSELTSSPRDPEAHPGRVAAAAALRRLADGVAPPPPARPDGDGAAPPPMR